MKKISFMIVLLPLITGCAPSYKPVQPPYTIYPSQPSPQEKPALHKTEPEVPAGGRNTVSGLPPTIVEKPLEETSQEMNRPLPKTEPKKAPSKGSSQQVASIHMVDTAKEMRQKGKIDEAIRTLERSVEIDPYNGEAFYELALCWKAKGKLQRALDFANRAETIFAKDKGKLKKVHVLKAQLLEDLGKKEEAKKYRK